jgi:hypothetical protein
MKVRQPFYGIPPGGKQKSMRWRVWSVAGIDAAGVSAQACDVAVLQQPRHGASGKSRSVECTVNEIQVDGIARVDAVPSSAQHERRARRNAPVSGFVPFEILLVKKRVGVGTTALTDVNDDQWPRQILGCDLRDVDLPWHAVNWCVNVRPGVLVEAPPLTPEAVIMIVGLEEAGRELDAGHGRWEPGNEHSG